MLHRLTDDAAQYLLLPPTLDHHPSTTAPNPRHHLFRDRRHLLLHRLLRKRAWRCGHAGDFDEPHCDQKQVEAVDYEESECNLRGERLFVL